MSKGDLTKFDAHIAALAMPDKSAITQAGDSMMKANDYIWSEKLKGLKLKNMELENKRGEQEYNFNEAKNPLLIDAAKLANQKSAMDIDETAKENDFKAQKRPFELATTAAQASSASSKADMDAFDAAHKQSVFDMDMSAKRANINATNASTYAQNFINRVNEDQYKTQDRANDMFWASEDLDTLEKERKARVDAVQNDPNLSEKRKYEEIRLINNAAMKTKDTYYKDLQSASNIDWTKARAAKANGTSGGKNDLNIGVANLKDVANLAGASSDLGRTAIEDITSFKPKFVGSVDGYLGDLAHDSRGFNAVTLGRFSNEGEGAWNSNADKLKAYAKEILGLGSALTKNEEALLDGWLGTTSLNEEEFKKSRLQAYKSIRNKLQGKLRAYGSRLSEDQLIDAQNNLQDLNNVINLLETYGWDKAQKVLQEQQKKQSKSEKVNNSHQYGYDPRGRKSVGNDTNATMPTDMNASRKGSTNAAMAYFTD